MKLLERWFLFLALAGLANALFSSLTGGDKKPEVDRVKMLRKRNEGVLQNNKVMFRNLGKVENRLNSVKNEISSLQTDYLPQMDRIITKMYMEIANGRPMKGGTIKAREKRQPKQHEPLSDDLKMEHGPDWEAQEQLELAQNAQELEGHQEGLVPQANVIAGTGPVPGDAQGAGVAANNPGQLANNPQTTSPNQTPALEQKPAEGQPLPTNTAEGQPQVVANEPKKDETAAGGARKLSKKQPTKIKRRRKAARKHRRRRSKSAKRKSKKHKNMV